MMFNGWDQATLATGVSPHPSYPAKTGSTLGQFELTEYTNIENPLLIEHKNEVRKFDIRQWVLVTSYDPL